MKVSKYTQMFSGILTIERLPEIFQHLFSYYVNETPYSEKTYKVIFTLDDVIDYSPELGLSNPIMTLVSIDGKELPKEFNRYPTSISTTLDLSILDQSLSINLGDIWVKVNNIKPIRNV